MFSRQQTKYLNTGSLIRQSIVFVTQSDFLTHIPRCHATIDLNTLPTELRQISEKDAKISS